MSVPYQQPIPPQPTNGNGQLVLITVGVLFASVLELLVIIACYFLFVGGLVFSRAANEVAWQQRNQPSPPAYRPPSTAPHSPPVTPRSAPGAEYFSMAHVSVNDRVHIKWGSSWYPGTVIEKRGTQARIHYDNHSNSWDEDVGLDRLRRMLPSDARYRSSTLPTPLSPPRVAADPIPITPGSAVNSVTDLKGGEKVHVFKDGRWLPGHVVQIRDSKVGVAHQGNAYVESFSANDVRLMRGGVQRTWNRKNDRPLVGELIHRSDNTVVINHYVSEKDCRQENYLLSSFSAADQAYVRSYFPDGYRYKSAEQKASEQQTARLNPRGLIAPYSTTRPPQSYTSREWRDRSGEVVFTGQLYGNFGEALVLVQSIPYGTRSVVVDKAILSSEDQAYVSGFPVLPSSGPRTADEARAEIQKELDQAIKGRSSKPNSLTPPPPSTPAVPSPTPSAPAVPDDPLAKMRSWTDSTGQYSLQAQLIAVEDGNVKLQRPDGKIVTMPIDKLSAADRALVRAKYP